MRHVIIRTTGGVVYTQAAEIDRGLITHTTKLPTATILGLTSDFSRDSSDGSPWQRFHDVNGDLYSNKLTRPTKEWLDSRVVSVLDSGAEGPGFKSQSQSRTCTSRWNVYARCSSAR